MRHRYIYCIGTFISLFHSFFLTLHTVCVDLKARLDWSMPQPGPMSHRSCAQYTVRNCTVSIMCSQVHHRGKSPWGGEGLYVCFGAAAAYFFRECSLCTVKNPTGYPLD